MLGGSMGPAALGHAGGAAGAQSMEGRKPLVDDSTTDGGKDGDPAGRMDLFF